MKSFPNGFLIIALLASLLLAYAAWRGMFATEITIGFLELAFIVFCALETYLVASFVSGKMPVDGNELMSLTLFLGGRARWISGASLFLLTWMFAPLFLQISNPNTFITALKITVGIALGLWYYSYACQKFTKCRK